MPGSASMRLSSNTDCALSVTGPKLSTAIVTGAIARKPNATSPNAKTGAPNTNRAGMSAIKSWFNENRYDVNISPRMTIPIQNAEKLPATNPESTFSDAPPWPEASVISWT